jgi:hypothetical protein
LGEYKGIIQSLKSIPTTEGFVVNGYSSSAVNNEFKVQWNEEKIESMVKEYEKKIEDLQDEINEYNAKTEI